MARAARVLIVGAQGFRRSDEQVEIECFKWEQAKNIGNASDYDGIILNLTSLATPTAVDWDSFFEKFTPEMTLEVLINSGRIVIIGDPRFLTDEPIYAHGGEDYPGREFLSWTGLKFDWDDRPGKTKRCNENDPLTKHFLSYIERISSWDYSLKDCRGPQVRPAHIARVLGKTETEFSSAIKLVRLCENRSGGAVVFAVELSVSTHVERLSGVGLPQVVRTGRIIFFPRIDMPGDEVVAMVMGILGISVVIPEPPWASARIAPGQRDIDQKIGEIKAKITGLEEDLKQSLKQREDMRRCVHLLYKIGDELEDAVRETLAKLGATVEPTTERGKEDGWITVTIGNEILEGVLEIKGTKNDHFPAKGLRQVMEWKSRGIINRNKEYKGIFIGNSAVEKEPSERQVPFVNDWVERARLGKIVGLDTCVLYQLYCLHCEGSLETAEFWRSLFQTNGVFGRDEPQ